MCEFQHFHDLDPFHANSFRKQTDRVLSSGRDASHATERFIGILLDPELNSDDWHRVATRAKERESTFRKLTDLQNLAVQCRDGEVAVNLDGGLLTDQST